MISSWKWFRINVLLKTFKWLWLLASGRISATGVNFGLFQLFTDY